MGDRLQAALAVLLVACVCGCSSSTAGHQRSSAGSSWTAAGVPAGSAGASGSSTAVVREPVTSTGTSTRPASSSPSPIARPEWASGPGAPAFPTPSAVDQHSVDAVAATGARAFASADTAVDDRPQHTAVRAALAGWLTSVYAHEQLAATVSASPGAQWDAWTHHRAFLVVTARLSGDDHPPDTPTVAARLVLLTLLPVGRDAWRGTTISEVVAVVLKRANGVWRIDSDQTS